MICMGLCMKFMNDVGILCPPYSILFFALLGTFNSGDDSRQKMSFGLWRYLIDHDRNAATCFVLITGFNPNFRPKSENATIAKIIEAARMRIHIHAIAMGTTRPLKLASTIHEFHT